MRIRPRRGSVVDSPRKCSGVAMNDPEPNTEGDASMRDDPTTKAMSAPSAPAPPPPDPDAPSANAVQNAWAATAVGRAVIVYLLGGSTLRGRFLSQDRYSVLLDVAPGGQRLVFKTAISSIALDS